MESFRKISQFNRDNDSKNKYNFGEADIDNIINNRNIELRRLNPIIDNENNNTNKTFIIISNMLKKSRKEPNKSRFNYFGKCHWI